MNITLSISLHLCVNVILQKYASQKDILSVAGFSSDLQFQSIRTKLKGMIHYNNFPVKPKLYLIEERDGEPLENQIETLGNVTNEGFNPRGKFIFIADNFSETLISKIASLYIVDVVFLKLESGELLTYFPYENGSLNSVKTTLVTLGNCRNVSNLNIFPTKLPKLWTNTTLRLTYRYFDAYAMCSSCPEKGIDIDLFNIILDHMNLKREYSLTPNITDLDFIGNFEIFIGNEGPKYGSKPFGDFSMSYTDDAIVWIIPAPQAMSRWRYFLEIFEKNVWAAFSSSICAVSLTWCIAKAILQKVSLVEFFTVPISTFNTFLGQAPIFKTTLASHSVLKVLIIFLSLMMNFFFSTRLTYLLNGLNMEANIDTLNDAIDAKLVIGCPSVLLPTFNNTKKRAEYLKINFFSCDQTPKCVMRAAKVRDMVVCRTIRRTRYLKGLVDKDTGKWMVKELKTPIYVKQVAAHFRRGFPLFGKINRHIFSLVESGIINVVIQKYEKKTVVGDFSTPVKELELDHLEAPLFLWVLGLVLAFIVFLMEKFYF